VTTRHAESITAEGIEVGLSRTDKNLFPDDRITKGDLVGYYQDLAGRMLPYLAGRPLVMARYPDGITGQRLFQKNVPGYFPDWITRTEVPKQGGTLLQVVCDKPATLVYLANQACIEMHVFTSRVGHLDRPDQVVFDLDPPDAGHFGEACAAALQLRDLLQGELGLTAFVKTTGGKGLHVHVPLRAADDFDEVRRFARDASGLIATRNPDLLTTAQRRNNRGSRVYADVMRNAYAQTVVAAYSVRARPGAPVAVPLHWEELTGDLEPGQFTLRTIRGWLERPGRGDPWADLTGHRHGLARAAGRLSRLRLAASDDPSE
jgi:bifunctional non-homologous end joining protein LigD